MYIMAGVDLRGMNLEGMNLRGMNLIGAVLRGMNLRGMNLRDLNLRGADLRGADLTDANLTHASLTSANLTDANLTDANLRGASLTYAKLRGATLTRADLSITFLSGADLRGADLIDATLRHAFLSHANLTDANLTGANLTGVGLIGARLRGANLTGANLTGVDVTGVDLTGAIGVIIPPPPLPTPPVIAQQGIAYQVHNAFNNLNIVTFMEIIRHNITPIYIEDELLEKLIIYSSINLPEKTEELIRINATIKTYSDKNNNDVQDVITFVLLQPDVFIKMYIRNFAEDCLKAYNTGNRESCIKGQYERVFLNLEGVLGLTCNQDADCPPVYKELLECFKPDYNQLFKDWFELGQHEDAETNYENKSPKEKEAYINAKKIEFKTYLVGQVGERHDIDEYIDANFSTRYTLTYDGGRKRKMNKRKTNKRKTNKRKTNKRKTNKRKD
jgi:hypothetical protein